MNAPQSLDTPHDEAFAHASAAALRRYVGAPDPDACFLDDLRVRIARARPRPRPARPRRALLLSYAGAGNTGADLRTIEAILQLRRLAPGLAIELFVLGPLFDHPVLAQVPKFAAPAPYVPDALEAAMARYDLVLNVEGSTYTSTFSDSLAGILVGGLALAAAQGARAVAYGVDSGRMSEALADFACATAEGVIVVTRNEAARAALARLGIRALPGTDPAWAYRAGRCAHDRPPTVAVCVSNPFWWPVRPDAARAARLDARGAASALRYGQHHFHAWDEDRAAAYARYVDAQASIVAGLARRGLAPVLVAMERLDERACVDVAARAGGAQAPRIVARGSATLQQVLDTLTDARCIVSTRFHAALVGIAHAVPVYGIAIDERIPRLLEDVRSAAWHADARLPNLAERVLDAFDDLAASAAERDGLEARYAAHAASQRVAFEGMARHLGLGG